MAIVIVDNGRGADTIAQLVRGAKVVKPNSIPDAQAYILSDGAMDKSAEKANIALISKTHRPVLGVGVGYIYVGLAFGATTKNGGCAKIEKITTTHRSPILLDLKKMFSVNDGQKLTLADIPAELGAVAKSAKNEFEVIQHGANLDNPVDAKPIFGTHFNPEAGLDGITVLKNFARFVELYNKYHR